LEESTIQKLVFDYGQDCSRKRPSDLNDEGISKRIRRQLQKIDLSSSSDSDSDECIQNFSGNETNVNVSSTIDNDQPTTSKEQNNENELEKVNILSVEIIPDDNSAAIEEDNEAQANIPSNDDGYNLSVNNKKRNDSDSNRIVISDSSDSEVEEQEQQRRRNRRFSDGNFQSYSSAYSFAGANGDNFDSRASFQEHNNDRYRHYNNNHHHHRRSHRDRGTHFHRVMNDARTAQENAMRTARNAANIFPRLLNQFQNQFRTLYTQPTWNQQFTSNFTHRF
jgi:hypothetical protein